MLLLKLFIALQKMYFAVVGTYQFVWGWVFIFSDMNKGPFRIPIMHNDIRTYSLREPPASWGCGRNTELGVLGCIIKNAVNVQVTLGKPLDLAGPQYGHL